jgi:WD40 repeat protein
VIIYVGYNDGSIRCFDTANLYNARESKNLDQIKAISNAHNGPVASLIPDKNKVLLFSGSRDKSLKIFSIKSDGQLKKRPIVDIKNVINEGITTMVINSNNQYLFVGGEKGSVGVFTMGRQSASFQTPAFSYFRIHKAEITNIFLSPDDQFMFTCSKDRSIKAFNVVELENLSTEAILHMKDVHEKYSECFCIDNECDYIYTTGGKGVDYRLAILDVGSLRRLDLGKSTTYGSIYYEDSAVTTMRIDNTDRFLFTGFGDGRLKIWNVGADSTSGNDQPFWEFPTVKSSRILAICISQDNKFLFCNGEARSINVWEIGGLPHFMPKRVFTFERLHSDEITKIKIRENKYMFTCSKDGSIKVFRIN